MFNLVTLPIFAICGWYYPSLVLTPEGISRYNVGYTLSTSWDNIIELRLTRGFEGLILRQPMEDRGAHRFAVAAGARFGIGAVPLYPTEIVKMIKAHRFIPIEAFAYWFKHGKLGDEIAGYAPGIAVQPARNK